MQFVYFFFLVYDTFKWSFLLNVVGSEGVVRKTKSFSGTDIDVVFMLLIDANKARKFEVYDDVSTLVKLVPKLWIMILKSE